MRALSLAFLRLRQVLYNRFQCSAPSEPHCVNTRACLAFAIETARNFPLASLRSDSPSRRGTRTRSRALRREVRCARLLSGQGIDVLRLRQEVGV
jgi:hypothetical protein